MDRASRKSAEHLLVSLTCLYVVTTWMSIAYAATELFKSRMLSCRLLLVDYSCH